MSPGLYLDHNLRRAEVKRNAILRVENLFVGVRTSCCRRCEAKRTFIAHKRDKRDLPLNDSQIVEHLFFLFLYRVPLRVPFSFIADEIFLFANAGDKDKANACAS